MLFGMEQQKTIDNKLSAFLEIAKTLNKYGITPILYGSLGLYRIVGQLDEINDIDIIIPNKNLIDRFSELMKIMEEIEYRQDAHYPHEFTKGNGQIGFEPDSDLNELGIDSEKLKITEIDDSKFKELSPADYLKVYKRNLEGQEKKLNSTRAKIEAIERRY